MSLELVEKKKRPLGGGCVGILLHFFDWNRRLAKSKLLAKRLRSPGSDVRRQAAMQTFSPVVEESGGARAPGLVARLMGLETMPAVISERPRKAFDSKSVENESESSGQDRCGLEISRPSKLQKAEHGEKLCAAAAPQDGKRQQRHLEDLKVVSTAKSPRLPPACGKRRSRLVQAAATKILDPKLRQMRAKRAIGYSNLPPRISREEGESMPESKSFQMVSPKSSETDLVCASSDSNPCVSSRESSFRVKDKTATVHSRGNAVIRPCDSAEIRVRRRGAPAKFSAEKVARKAMYERALTKSVRPKGIGLFDGDRSNFGFFVSRTRKQGTSAADGALPCAPLHERKQMVINVRRDSSIGSSTCENQRMNVIQSSNQLPNDGCSKREQPKNWSRNKEESFVDPFAPSSRTAMSVSSFRGKKVKGKGSVAPPRTRHTCSMNEKPTSFDGDRISKLLEKIEELNGNDRTDLPATDAASYGKLTASALAELISDLTKGTSLVHENNLCSSASLADEMMSQQDVTTSADYSIFCDHTSTVNEDYQGELESYLAAPFLNTEVDQPSPLSVFDASFSTDSCSMESANDILGSSEVGSAATVVGVMDKRKKSMSYNLGSVDLDVLEDRLAGACEALSNAELLISHHSESRYFLLNALEAAVSTFAASILLGSPDESKAYNLLCTFLFDCAIESMILRCGHVGNLGCKMWLKLSSLFRSEDSVKAIILEDLTGWKDLSRNGLDALLAKEQNLLLWDFSEANAHEAGHMIESGIFRALLAELVAELLQ